MLKRRGAAPNLRHAVLLSAAASLGQFRLVEQYEQTVQADYLVIRRYLDVEQD